MAQVLVANGDEVLAQAQRLALTEAGHVVEIACSGTAALQAIAYRETDVIVADLRLPGLSGLELCRLVADEHPGLPVLLLTSEVALDTAVAAIRAGAYDYLTVPVPRQALLTAVERASRHRSLRRRIALVRANEGDDLESLPTLEEVERRYVAHVLDVAANNKTAASRVLGIDRKTLYRRLGVDAGDDPLSIPPVEG